MNTCCGSASFWCQSGSDVPFWWRSRFRSCLDSDPTPRFTHVGKSEFSFRLLFTSSASPHCFIFLISVTCVIIFEIWAVYWFFGNTVQLYIWLKWIRIWIMLRKGRTWIAIRNWQNYVDPTRSWFTTLLRTTSNKIMTYCRWNVNWQANEKMY